MNLLRVPIRRLLATVPSRLPSPSAAARPAAVPPREPRASADRLQPAGTSSNAARISPVTVPRALRIAGRA